MEMEALMNAEVRASPSAKPEGEVSDTILGKSSDTAENPLTQASGSMVFATVTKATDRPGMTGGGDDTVKGMGDKRFTNNRKNVSKVKTISMGEIPLRPVGLSLSGSGMQLYVKVDNFLHKEQLANLENQFVAKVCKMSTPRIAGKMRRGKKKSCQKEPAETPSASQKPSHKTNDGIVCPSKKMATSNSHSKDCFMVRPVCCDETIEIDEDSEPSTTKVHQSGVDVVIKQEVSDFDKESDNVKERNGYQRNCANPSLVDTPSASLGTAVNISTVTYQRRQARRNANCLKATFRRGKKSPQQRQEMMRTKGIQTNPVTEWSIVRPEAVHPSGQEKEKKRPMPLVFTSSDLPLKRLSAVRSCSSADNLIHQQRNNSGFFSPIRPVESGVGAGHTYYCSTNNADSRVSSHSAFGFSSKVAMSTEAERQTPSSKYALVDALSPELDTRASPLLHQEASTLSSPGRSSPSMQQDKSGIESDPGLDTRREDDATPLSGADFDTAQVLASGVVDAETLAKFAEYTSSMRRDLKQNYKKLSELMKNFNQELMDHYREQVDMDTNVSAGLDSSVDITKSSSQNRCVLM